MSKTKETQDKSQIIFKSLNQVLHESMIPYTEHVVMDRALPRVEDGLKPVQRRILYSMMELGVTPDKPYRKSARIVGDCMGKYHPHGDSSVYDAMVRMAQNYSLREPLVDGHGNFGSIDGDSAAAMRYTEARLAPLALELLRDLDKDTVDWSLNFDDTTKEPNMLPGRFPNLLVNGATGIAVGVATNIPSHNLGEVIDGVCAYVKNPKISLSQMMKHIKAPDFPTGGKIIAGNGLLEAYATGKGKIVLEAQVHIEKDGEKSAIVITEIPYQVNKSALLQKIAELKGKEKGLLSYIGEITDESDRNGLRAVIKVKKDGNAKAILNYLMKNTNLRVNYNINMVAIAGGKPKLMGLLDIISYYTAYQIEVIVRRTRFELNAAEARAHIVEGLLVAINNIDEIVRIIKKSHSVSEAKQRIMERFSLSEAQTQAILDMRIARLVNLEVQKLQEEFAQLQEKIARFKAILSSKEEQENLLIHELKDIKGRFGNKRKSEVDEEKDEEQAEIFDFMADSYSELNHIVLSADHRLKRLIIKNNTPSKALPTALHEINTMCIKANDNEQIFAFTNKGTCVKLRVKDIPLSVQWKGKGELLCDINKTFKFDEYVVCIMPIPKNPEEVITMFTKNGFAKRSKVSEFDINRAYFLGMTVKEGDELINVCLEKDEQNILAITKQSYSLKFNINEVDLGKRTSVGVKIVKLQDGDEVIFAAPVGKIGSITVLAASGAGKRIPVSDFETMTKYRRGLKVIGLKSARDSVIFAQFGLENFDIAYTSKDKIKALNNGDMDYEARAAKGKLVDRQGIESAHVMLDKSNL